MTQRPHGKTQAQSKVPKAWPVPKVLRVIPEQLEVRALLARPAPLAPRETREKLALRAFPVKTVRTVLVLFLFPLLLPFLVA
jgi:hypothetical protein